MEKVTITIEVKLKDFGHDLKPGDYFKYENIIYKFDGWDYGAHPIATNVQTNEQVQLPYC